MMNNTLLVGRITNDLKIQKTENEKSYTDMTVAVPRSYKNEDGVYEIDFIKCRLWGALADNTVEYCSKGDLIGVKGRIETRTYEDENGKHYVQEVVADKVTFLSSKQKEKENSNEMNI